MPSPPHDVFRYVPLFTLLLLLLSVLLCYNYTSAIDSALPGAFAPIRMPYRPKYAESTNSPPPYVRQPFRRQSSNLGTSTLTRRHDVDVEKHELAEDFQNGGSQRMAGLGVANLHSLPHLHKQESLEAKLNQNNTSNDALSSPSAGSRFSLSSEPTAVQDSPQMSELGGFNSSPVKGRPQLSRSGRSDRSASPEPNSLSVTSKRGLACPTEGDILANSWSRFTIPILILAWYSTIFSAIYLGIALAKPRWGERIGTEGHITYSQATLLSTSIAKTIELSFGTVFVTLLGQILTRRAVARRKEAANTGFSIAEMSMRSWISQPVSLLTDWSILRYTVATLLGAMAVVATLVTAFYGTAAEAVVSPKLKLGRLEDRALVGKVSAQFANLEYLQQNCKTPISPIDDDAPDRGTSCLQVEHAGQSYHNFQSFLSAWGDLAASGKTTGTSGNLHMRPQASAMFNEDNIKVSGQWINPSHANVTKDSQFHQRLVQNVTMAMPHANVISAINNLNNYILKPHQLQGSGEFYVSASVPAPTVNILCVGMSGEELTPLIHPNVSCGLTPNNATVVDDLFRFSEKFGDLRQPTPCFPKVPRPFNTVVNSTQNYGADSIYLLATPPPNTKTNEHVLCSVKAMQYPNCTTMYHMAENGGDLSVYCGKDKNNIFPYTRYHPEAPSGVWEKNWKDVGSDWLTALAFNDGISDSNASVARLVTQMIPEFDTGTDATSLDPSLPSIGEAIGVLAASTMLLSSQNAPFIHFWNYSAKVSSLENPQWGAFNASIKYKDYASGPTQQWHVIFYFVLFAAFFLNCFGLVYLTWRFYVDGQVTDYTEPANLFALAINSPPSTTMRGSCGAGPSDEVLGKKWQVNMDVDVEDTLGSSPGGGGGGFGMKHPHFYIHCPDDEEEDSRPKPRRKLTVQSMQSTWGGESPAVEQYRRLRKP